MNEDWIPESEAIETLGMLSRWVPPDGLLSSLCMTRDPAETDLISVRMILTATDEDHFHFVFLGVPTLATLVELSRVARRILESAWEERVTVIPSLDTASMGKDE